MSLSAQAQIATRLGSRHIADLCQQLERRLADRPAPGTGVAWTDSDGTIELGWARCELHADADGLTLRAEAAEQDALDQVCELIARHLEAHADEPLQVVWSHQTGGRAHEERRDHMRGFHARMGRRH